jgi:hypothetical protein
MFAMTLFFMFTACVTHVVQTDPNDLSKGGYYFSAVGIRAESCIAEARGMADITNPDHVRQELQDMLLRQQQGRWVDKGPVTEQFSDVKNIRFLVCSAIFLATAWLFLHSFAMCTDR